MYFFVQCVIFEMACQIERLNLVVRLNLSKNQCIRSEYKNMGKNVESFRLETNDR